MNHLITVKGFKTSGISAGIKKDSTKKDLMLIYSEQPAVTAGVFTVNLASAAPVQLSKARMSSPHHRAILVNSGNANACTGEEGLRNAALVTEAAAKLLKVSPDEVLNASTGIIGVQLPAQKVTDALPALVEALEDCSSASAAEAILTTDTFPKFSSRKITVGNTEVSITGFSKGSGMIHPNMATMLGFVLTDASIRKELLQKALADATTVSFNQVSVDGDTSTNDCCFVMASGMAGNTEITEAGTDYEQFAEALKAVCIDLAKLIAQDGEGATKLLEARVTGAVSDSAAQRIAKSVISSSLVKSAFFGNDANWGRIVCAMGYAGVPVNLDTAAVTMLSAGGQVTVFQEGAGLVFDEALALEVLKQKEIVIDIRLTDGDGSGTAWGCDLTYEYVKINGEYRS